MVGTSRPFIVIGVGVGWLAAAAAAGRAGEDAATAAMRREVAARVQRQEAEFDRLRAVPAGGAEVRFEARFNGAMVVEEPLVEGELPDEVQGDDTPPRPARFVIAESVFDRIVFAGAGNAEGARDRLELLLKSRIEVVVRTYGLSPARRDKLRLAGRGDVKRLFDRVEEMRREFREVRTDVNRFQTFRLGLQRLSNDVLTGPFSDRSLYGKVLLRSIRDVRAEAHRGD